MACRMYEALHPNEGDIVMIQADSLTEEHAAVVLLIEYNNIHGIIKDSATVYFGRIEPRRVRSVTGTPVSILLSKKKVLFADKHAALVRFNKNKHVRTVMAFVAREEGLDLLQLYTSTGWPQYDDVLMKSGQDYWRSYGLSARVIKALTDGFKNITLRSWRILNSEWLGPSDLEQIIDICWAFGIVRQMDALLKKKGILQGDEYLSIQDLVNKANGAGLLDFSGGLDSIESLRPILTISGLVLEQYCPLTQSLAVKGETAPEARVYKVRIMEVFENDKFDSDTWEYMLGDYLLHEPFAVSVPWYKSFDDSDEDGVIEPTDEEWDSDDEPEDNHIMVLTGEGVDEHGVPYWEMQDSRGDIGVADFGFRKFAKDPNLVEEFLFLET